MMRAIITAMATCALACEGIDIHYVGDAANEQALTDAGPVNVEEGNPVGSDGLCGCDFTLGEGCCLPSGGGGAFCTSNGVGCTQQRGIFVGCNAFDPSSGSECCWHGAASGGSLSSYAAACTSGPTSCATASDCNGGTCKLAVCGGVTLGACDVDPTCP